MIGERQAYALRALNDALSYLYTCWQQPPPGPPHRRADPRRLQFRLGYYGQAACAGWVRTPSRGGVLPPRRVDDQQTLLMLTQACAFQACQYVPASARNRPWLAVGPTVVMYSALPVVCA